MLRRALLAALLLFSAVPAMAQQNDPSFRVVNNTQQVVNEVYASPATDRSWGHDRLGAEVIMPGRNFIVRLPPGDCVYDVRIVYQGGRSEERRGLNTCNITDLVLGQGGQAPQAQDQGTGQTGNPSFNLLNQSGRQIQEFYASPSSNPNWGRDLLGDDVVQPNQRYAIRLPMGECQYDLRWVFAGGQAQERRNINLCTIADFPVR